MKTAIIRSTLNAISTRASVSLANRHKAASLVELNLNPYSALQFVSHNLASKQTIILKANRKVTTRKVIMN